jgi:uncharacterized membrane protein YqaE (UPF0057 family)
MRRFTILFLAVVFSIASNAGIIYVPSNTTDNAKAFATVVPAAKETKGKKMTFGQKIAMKFAKMKGKKAADIPKGLYVVGAIFGFAWLLMGLMDDFKGNNWWINLILYILFWIPGLIHALIKMKEYYK